MVFSLWWLFYFTVQYKESRNYRSKKVPFCGEMLQGVSTHEVDLLGFISSFKVSLIFLNP